MPKALVFACFIFLRVLVAEQLPSLHPRVYLPREYLPPEFWLSTPIIVVVSINQVRMIGPDVEITPNQLAVRLVSVEADVETVVSGELEHGPTVFYFYTNSLACTACLTTHVWWLDRGERYVVFLRKDGGVLRTMTDLTGFEVHLFSGRHDTAPAPRSRVLNDLGERIAAIALTPGDGYSKSFAAAMEATYDRLLGVTTPGRLAPLVRSLLSHPDGEIRERACLAIMMNYSYRDACISKLADSSDPTIRQRAAFWGQGKRQIAAHLLKAIREDPSSISRSGRVEDIARDLELYTFDIDGVVRQMACDALERLFPTRNFTNCASKH